LKLKFSIGTKAFQRCTVMGMGDMCKVYKTS